MGETLQKVIQGAKKVYIDMIADATKQLYQGLSKLDFEKFIGGMFEMVIYGIILAITAAAYTNATKLGAISVIFTIIIHAMILKSLAD